MQRPKKKSFVPQLKLNNAMREDLFFMFKEKLFVQNCKPFNLISQVLNSFQNFQFVRVSEIYLPKANNGSINPNRYFSLPDSL
jgi:hypothetical protein